MPARAAPTWILLALLAAMAWWPSPGHAQIRRCAGPDGQLIFTDRNCNEIGATDRLPRTGAAYVPPAYRGGCPRRLRDLVQGLTNAIDARDVNRLALYYDWSGMSTRQGYAVMTRLDAVAARPLVDVLPVYPQGPPPVLAADGSVADANADGYYPRTATQRRPPVALRLEQTFNSGTAPVRTVFGLRRRLGCWWVSF